MNKDSIRKHIDALRDALLEEENTCVKVMDGLAQLGGEPPKQPSLLPCPACGGEAGIDGFVGRPAWDDWTECIKCGMRGPEHDSTGSKWNAMPRRNESGIDFGTDQERQRWIARARLLRWPHDEGHTSEWWGGWNSVIGALLEDMGVRDE